MIVWAKLATRVRISCTTTKKYSIEFVGAGCLDEGDISSPSVNFFLLSLSLSSIRVCHL
jgi:hypothetical protein